MAILKKGITGSITGKLGNLVGYKLKGQWVVRTVPRSNTKNKAGSPAQQVCRKKFKEAQGFMNGTRRYTESGFELEDKKRDITALNAARSSIIRTAFDEDNNFVYEKVMVSVGDLEGVENGRVQHHQDGFIITWDNLPKVNGPSSRDQIKITVYAPEFRKSFGMLSGARRKEGQQIIEIPLILKEKSFHVWASFVSDDRKSISDSCYLGEIIYK